MACTSIQSKPPVVAPKRVIMVPATEGNHSLEKAPHGALYCNDWGYEMTAATKYCIYNNSHFLVRPTGVHLSVKTFHCLVKYTFCLVYSICIGRLQFNASKITNAKASNKRWVLSESGFSASAVPSNQNCSHMNPILAYPQWWLNKRRHLTTWCVLSLGLWCNFVKCSLTHYDLYIVLVMLYSVALCCTPKSKHQKSLHALSFARIDGWATFSCRKTAFSAHFRQCWQFLTHMIHLNSCSSATYEVTSWTKRMEKTTSTINKTWQQHVVPNSIPRREKSKAACLHAGTNQTCHIDSKRVITYL